MIRRVGFASLVVVAFAFAGASGTVRPLQSLRLVVAVAWLNAPSERERETRLLADRVAQPVAITVSRAPHSGGFRSVPIERWLCQRPPPAL